jgi:hypothetical protein
MITPLPSLTFPLVPPSPRAQLSPIPESQSPPSIEFWRDLALSDSDLSAIDSPTLSHLLRDLKSELDQLISSGLDSEPTYLAFHRLKSLHLSRVKLSAQTARQTDLFHRLSIARSALQTLRETIAVQESNISAEISEQLSELQARQQNEIAEFAAEWERNPKLRFYNRSSTLLRQLRVQANLLLNQHRYDEMNAVVRQADELEELETRENRRRLQQDYEDGLLKLQRKQIKERRAMERIQKEKKDRHEAAKIFDLNAAEQRIRNLETEIENARDPQKFWNLRHRFDLKILGGRPKGGGKTERCKVEGERFNVLSLPPLMEKRRGKREEWKGSREKQEQKGKLPRYSWL